MAIGIDQASWDEIVEHCKRRIADYLGTVECTENPRDKRDWYTACELLNKHEGIVREAVRILIQLPRSEPLAMIGDLRISCSYVTFDRLCGRMIWDAFQQLRGSIPRPPYGAILFV
jgi:hypothetical protein